MEYIRLLGIKLSGSQGSLSLSDNGILVLIAVAVVVIIAGMVLMGNRKS